MISIKDRMGHWVVKDQHPDISSQRGSASASGPGHSSLAAISSFALQVPRVFLGNRRPLLCSFWHADCFVAGMADDDYLLVILQIVCLLIFSCGVAVLTQHLEWFGA